MDLDPAPSTPPPRPQPDPTAKVAVPAGTGKSFTIRLPAKLHIPTWGAIVLSAILTILTVLNQTVFRTDLHIGQPWTTLITAVLGGGALLGIGPLVHGQLSTVLHLPYPVALAASGMIVTAMTGVTTVGGLTNGWRAAIIGAMTALAGALAGPTIPPSKPSTL